MCIQEGGHAMITLFKLFFKLMFLPLYIPLYIMWAFTGRLLGGRHQVYDMWKWD